FIPLSSPCHQPQSFLFSSPHRLQPQSFLFSSPPRSSPPATATVSAPSSSLLSLEKSVSLIYNHLNKPQWDPTERNKTVGLLCEYFFRYELPCIACAGLRQRLLFATKESSFSILAKDFPEYKNKCIVYLPKNPFPKDFVSNISLPPHCCL
ncbi:hypothetical protein Tsubulata_042599, partial [Turnera subulata]